MTALNGVLQLATSSFHVVKITTVDLFKKTSVSPVIFIKSLQSLSTDTSTCLFLKVSIWVCLTNYSYLQFCVSKFLNNGKKQFRKFPNQTIMTPHVQNTLMSVMFPWCFLNKRRGCSSCLTQIVSDSQSQKKFEDYIKTQNKKTNTNNKNPHKMKQQQIQLYRKVQSIFMLSDKM